MSLRPPRRGLRQPGRFHAPPAPVAIVVVEPAGLPTEPTGGDERALTVQELAGLLDRLGVPPTAGIRPASVAIRASGQTCRQQVVSDAVRLRRERAPEPASA